MKPLLTLLLLMFLISVTPQTDNALRAVDVYIPVYDTTTDVVMQISAKAPRPIAQVDKTYA